VTASAIGASPAVQIEWVVVLDATTAAAEQVHALAAAAVHRAWEVREAVAAAEASAVAVVAAVAAAVAAAAAAAAVVVVAVAEGGKQYETN
jgi:hypothetical protein